MGARTIVINSQGRYEVSADNSLVLPGFMPQPEVGLDHQLAGDALDAEIDALDLAGLTTRVAEAVAAVARGEVTALEPQPAAPVESSPSN